jgi:hypothetical protein
MQTESPVHSQEGTRAKEVRMSEPTEISPLEKSALANLAMALVVWQERKTGDGTKMAREAMEAIREMPPIEVPIPDNDFDEGFALGVFCVLCDLEYYRQRKGLSDLANGT